MPPKKANAFMIFTLEWKSKYGKHMSVSQATEAAGKIWAKMNDHERAPYKEKAKEEKNQQSGKKTEKLTCTGAPVSLVEKEAQEKEAKERLMKEYIENFVRCSAKSEELDIQSYFFIMVNYFTKTLKGGVYVPAELSVCEFSLKDGVKKTYHTLINPGVNIYGHQYEAQHYSETTHKLPLPPNALGEKNLGLIYNDILNFIRNKNSNDYPPLYTLSEKIHIVESVLDFLKADVGANNIDLKIYPIQYLFFIMKEATCAAGEVPTPINFYVTNSFLDRDFFEYQVGISCHYHEGSDTSKHCTKSYVTRWGYMFSDYMCHDIAITLIPGRHCPENMKLNAVITPAPSTCNDNASIISMGSTSSCATKPVAGSKIYYDDQKSEISDDDFPDMAVSKKSGVKPKPSSVQTCNRSAEEDIMDDDDDYGVEHLNPFANRSRVVTREPDDANFTIDYTKDESDNDDYNSVASFGRGRGSMLSSSLMNSSNVSTSSGRGRLNCPKK